MAGPGPGRPLGRRRCGDSTNPDVGLRENEALCERIATLHAAILKSNASLDLDTVLGEVLDCARRLN